MDEMISLAMQSSKLIHSSLNKPYSVLEKHYIYSFRLHLYYVDLCEEVDMDVVYLFIQGFRIKPTRDTRKRSNILLKGIKKLSFLSPNII